MNLRAYRAWLLKLSFICVTPVGCEINDGRMKECSKTMLLLVSFVGKYFYMFTKNLKTRLKGQE